MALDIIAIVAQNKIENAVVQLIDKETLIPVLAIGGGLIVAAIWIVFATIHAMVVARAREQTKRELAAYVAEGTLDPDKAIAMIKAGKSDDDECEAC